MYSPILYFILFYFLLMCTIQAFIIEWKIKIIDVFVSANFQYSLCLIYIFSHDIDTTEKNASTGKKKNHTKSVMPEL